MALPGGRRPARSGRSAACRVCNGSEATDACSCILDCGHTACTGAPSGVVPDSWPKRRGMINNPEGKGGLTGKGVDRKPPKYDGPGKGKS
jgi:hypothetical protein